MTREIKDAIENAVKLGIYDCPRQIGSFGCACENCQVAFFAKLTEVFPDSLNE